MFYVRVHHLGDRTTKTVHITDNEQEAHDVAVLKVHQIAQVKPVLSLVSVDDDIDQVHDYDQMIQTVLTNEMADKAINLGMDVIKTGNPMYPNVEVVRP